MLMCSYYGPVHCNAITVIDNMIGKCHQSIAMKSCTKSLSYMNVRNVYYSCTICSHSFFRSLSLSSLFIYVSLSLSLSLSLQTALCNTVIDNPLNMDEVISQSTKYLSTDTIWLVDCNM